MVYTSVSQRASVTHGGRRENPVISGYMAHYLGAGTKDFVPFESNAIRCHIKIYVMESFSLKTLHGSYDVKSVFVRSSTILAI